MNIVPASAYPSLGSEEEAEARSWTAAVAANAAIFAVGKAPKEYERVPLPAPIAKAMKWWREGFADMPQSYIEFHADMAKARLEALRIAYGLDIAKSWMADGSWMDGMRELHAVVLKRNGDPIHLIWNDGNQDFMRKCVGHGGQSALMAGDLE